jgi:hypothetical protein
MWKPIAIGLLVFVAILGLLVVLQTSSQEAASGSVLAAETAAQAAFEQLKMSKAHPQLDNAAQTLASIKTDAKSQNQITQVLDAINQVRGNLTQEEIEVGAASREVQDRLERARSNLAFFTAVERTRSVREQIVALTWPLVIGLLALYLLRSQSSISFFRQLASVVSNVKIPGALEIHHSTAVKSSQEDVLRAYRQQVIASYDAVAAQFKIAETMSRVVDGPITKFYGGTLPKKFRCTVHVQDMLFQDSFYQLIDYLPRSASGVRGTHGRAWSVLRGIVGQSWRLEESRFESSVPKTPRDLILSWGMIKQEADIVLSSLF